MEVILLERVENLGQMGQVVKVRPGFARNYLLPQRKAMRATKANMAHFEKQRAQLEAVNLQRRQEAQHVAEKMGGLSVVVTRQAGDTGVLYGSVSPRDVAQAVTEAGFTIDKRQVTINEPIKTLGLFKLRVNLHPEVHVFVTVNVARTQEEAQLQAQRGGMVTAASLAEEEEAEIAAQRQAEAEAEAAAAAEEDEQG